MGGGVLNRKREVWEMEEGDLQSDLFVPSCRRSLLKTETRHLPPFILSPHQSEVMLLSVVKPQKRASIPVFFLSPPIPTLHLVWGSIFRLSPLWMCVYGVVLTKRDLVQARSVGLKAGLCDVAVLQGRASELCIYCITVSYGLYKKAFILFISLIAVLRCSQTNGFPACQRMSLKCI